MNTSHTCIEIVEHCKLIHYSKLPLVQELVLRLQKYSLGELTHNEKHSRRVDTKTKRHKRAERSHNSAIAPTREEANDKPLSLASLDKMDEYMEKLYDDNMEEKIKGTSMILELAKDAGNLETLVQNESLMGALSRVLKEDYKHSMGLVLNLMYIFFSFSTFSQMHPALTNYRVGKETMRVVDLEIKRYALRMKEIQTMTRIAALQDRGETIPRDLWSSLQTQDDQKRIRKKKKSYPMDATQKDPNDDVGELKNVPTEKRIDIDRERNKVRQFIKKQDKLLFVCFHVLMNIAEDVQIERKIVKRTCVEYLASVLDRTNAELLILAVNFLKKLSVFEENKNRMIDADIVPKLVKFIPCSNKALMQAVSRLMLNLSFDATLREEMVKSSLIPKLVELLKHASFRQISLKILYHLSMDDRCKSMFTYTDSIPIIRQLLVNFPNAKIPIELVALTINLSHNARNAEMLCQDGGLKKLVHRVFRYR